MSSLTMPQLLYQHTTLWDTEFIENLNLSAAAIDFIHGIQVSNCSVRYEWIWNLTVLNQSPQSSMGQDINTKKDWEVLCH